MKKLIRSFNTEFEQNGEDLAIIDTTQRAAKPIMIDSHVLDEAIKNGDQDALNMISIDVNNQELTITPSTEKQTFIPDTNYTGFSPVVVEAAPLEDLTSELYTYSNELTEQEVTVEELTELLKTKGISEPPKYKPQFISFSSFEGTDLRKEFENLDLSEVKSCYGLFNNCYNLEFLPEEIDVSNSENFGNLFSSANKLKNIPKINTSKGKNFIAMYSGTNLEEYPLIDTSNATDMSSLHLSCSQMLIFPEYDTSNATKVHQMISGCKKIKTLPLLDFSKADSVYKFLGYSGTFELENVGGFKNLGKNFTQKSANNYNYTFEFALAKKLTHDSLMNIINNLYDLNLSYDVANGGTLYTQKLVLGSDNLSKLTAEEIAIATAKGWTVS